MTTKEAPAVHQDAKDRKKAWLAEEILVEFFNLEEPGVPIKFTYGPTNRPEKHSFLHGGKYRLKREIVNHIESRQTPIWGYKPDGSGRMGKSMEGYKSRFQCRQIFE